MLMIPKSKVHLVEGQPRLLAEASEVGLLPGEWPDFVAVVERVDGDTLGGLMFQKSRQIQCGGWEYVTKDGRFHLEILND